MVNLRAHSQRFLERSRADRHNHKLLHVNRIIRVFAAVHNVHHRHGHSLCVKAAQILVKGHIHSLCRSLCHRHGNAQNRVCAQFCLVWCPVQRNHSLVNCNLVQSIHADDFISDNIIYIIHSILHAYAVVAFTAIAQLHSFKRTCRRTTGYCRTPDNAFVYNHLDLDCRVPSGIQNLSCVNICNFVIAFHILFLLLKYSTFA